MHARDTPSMFEVGYYGKEGTDNHNIGKPSVGVHLSVEANSLSGLDFFDPPEERWVSGAMAFDLGTLAPGTGTGMDVLLSLDTSSSVEAPPIKLDVLATSGYDTTTDEMVVHFEETTSAPIDLFVLRRSTTGRPGGRPEDYEDVGTIPASDATRTFRVPVPEGTPRGFYHVEARLFP